MSNAKQDHISSAQLVYARALVELADEAGRLDEITEQVKELLALIRREQGLAQLLETRMLSVEQREKVLKSVFQGQVDELILNCMQVINAKGRLNLMPSILDAYLKLVDERRGVIDVEAHVASKLDDASAARVAEDIGRALGGKVTLSQRVDPALIGGIKLRIGDRVIDGSVSARLRQVRRRLIEAGREQARTVNVSESGV